MADESISAGNGRRLQVRAAREGSWTAANRRVFLDHLATTCNVRRAAQAVGMSEPGAYALRRRDPEFARQWQEAVQLGYEVVEAMLLARAMGTGADAVLPEREDGDPVPPSPETMDTELAMSLMRQQLAGGASPGKRIGPRPRCATKAELVAELNKRIAAVKRRREKRQ
jgi:hypothetical protein